MVNAPKKIGSEKPWWKSKTIWLGVLSVAAAVVTSLADLNPTVTSAILAGLGAATIAIRATEKGA